MTKKHILDAQTPSEQDLLRRYKENSEAMRQEAIDKIQGEFPNISLNGRLSYAELKQIQVYLIRKFIYTSDGYQFDKKDLWNPISWILAVLGDKWHGDCDDFGYAVLGILHYGFNYEGEDLNRVSCSTETAEPHFITWVVDDKDIYYQMENRLKVPQTITTMRHRGYTYWDYSSMSASNIQKNIWYDAEPKASQIIYHTPAVTNADSVDMMESIDMVDKSRTLKVSGGTMITAGTGVVTAIASQQDWKVVALLLIMGLLGGVYWYLRMDTHKSLRSK